MRGDERRRDREGVAASRQRGRGNVPVENAGFERMGAGVARTSSIHAGDSSSPSSNTSGVTLAETTWYASSANLKSCPPFGERCCGSPPPGVGGAGSSGSAADEGLLPIGRKDARESATVRRRGAV